MSVDGPVPIGSDRYTLEDSDQGLSYAVGQDKESKAPQQDDHRPADGEDTTIQEKDGEFNASHGGIVNCLSRNQCLSWVIG